MSPDFLDLLRAFSGANARFLVVGAYAVGVHGRPRIASLEEDARVPTDSLLARIPGQGRSLEQRVFDWLRSMAAGWDSALPLDGQVAAPFITDIVPAASGSLVREVA